MRSLLWFFVAVAAFVSACKRGGNESAAEAPAVTGVRTALATRGPFATTVNAIGTVSVRPDRDAALAAPGPTRVARIFVFAGQRVADRKSVV